MSASMTDSPGVAPATLSPAAAIAAPQPVQENLV